MDSIETLLREAVRQLENSCVPDPRRDAELLLSHILGRSRSFLLSHPEDQVGEAEAVHFREWVSRRTTHYPVQYLLGTQEFFGRLFEVDERVLIPRPETELLIETALSLLEATMDPWVVDVGTGSGCIAVTLACERPDCSILATEISPVALQVARSNACRLGVGEQVDFRLGSVLEPVGTEGPFDLIVSNPPYVSHQDPRVTTEVRENEPREAVFSGATGLEIHGELFRQALPLLKPGGKLVIEIGAGQYASVSSLAENRGWRLSSVRKDLAGLDRCLVLTPKG
ncbi:MAG: peptide chain release factor N(5)-glutamine methyltransferase [Acidobacteriota bacterium]